MRTFSLFYAALGYVALLTAILCATLFTGDGSRIAMMDVGNSDTSLHATLIDGALIALAIMLYGLAGRGILKNALKPATNAWLASMVIVVVLCEWRPIPQILWQVPDLPAAGLSLLFYAGWTLVLIGTFLASRRELFELSQNKEWARYSSEAGILLGVWSTSEMSIGHFYLAAALTGYVLVDVILAAYKARSELIRRSDGVSSSVGAVTGSHAA